MKRTRQFLKGRFENGDRPTSEDFEDLFDSTIIKADDSAFDILPVGTIIESDVELTHSSLLHLNGQLVNINTYPLLYSKYGVDYGGDGLTTFGLPTKGLNVDANINWIGLPTYNKTVSFNLDTPLHSDLYITLNSLTGLNNKLTYLVTTTNISTNDLTVTNQATLPSTVSLTDGTNTISFDIQNDSIYNQINLGSNYGNTSGWSFGIEKYSKSVRNAWNTPYYTIYATKLGFRHHLSDNTTDNALTVKYDYRDDGREFYNLGIGTNDPLYNLDLYQASGGANIRIKSGDNSSFMRIDCATSKSSGVAFQCNGGNRITMGYSDANNNFFLWAQSTNSNLMEIDYSSGELSYPYYGNGLNTGTDAYFATWDYNGKLLESTALTLTGQAIKVVNKQLDLQTQLTGNLSDNWVTIGSLSSTLGVNTKVIITGLENGTVNGSYYEYIVTNQNGTLTLTQLQGYKWGNDSGYPELQLVGTSLQVKSRMNEIKGSYKLYLTQLS